MNNGYKCVRCEREVSWTEADRRCPAAPDRGPHEGIAPFQYRRAGWSTHTATCPTATPIALGTELVDCACTCRTVLDHEGKETQ